MAKRKPPRGSDQPELPLGGQGDSESPAVRETAAVPEPKVSASERAGPARTGPKFTPVAAKKGAAPEAPLSSSYRDWFLEYASYVILDRAVPHIDDGLKPVQRRILHTLWEMDDGRFHKVANVVGAAMRYHPHGDASIGAALVGMGQRAFLIEPQGNFGNL